jgi:hypothetical protein
MEIKISRISHGLNPVFIPIRMDFRNSVVLKDRPCRTTTTQEAANQIQQLFDLIFQLAAFFV